MNVVDYETRLSGAGMRSVPDLHAAILTLPPFKPRLIEKLKSAAQQFCKASLVIVARKPWIGAAAALALTGCAADITPDAGHVQACDVICHLLRFLSLEEAHALPLPDAAPKLARRSVPMPPERPHMARHDAANGWIKRARFEPTSEDAWPTPPAQPDQNWNQPLPGSDPIKVPRFEPMLPLRPLAPLNRPM